jgi:hypothetical protein
MLIILRDSDTWETKSKENTTGRQARKKQGKKTQEKEKEYRHKNTRYYHYGPKRKWSIDTVSSFFCPNRLSNLVMAPG